MSRFASRSVLLLLVCGLMTVAIPGQALAGTKSVSGTITDVYPANDPEDPYLGSVVIGTTKINVESYTKITINGIPTPFNLFLDRWNRDQNEALLHFVWVILAFRPRANA